MRRLIWTMVLVISVAILIFMIALPTPPAAGGCWAGWLVGCS